MDIIRGEEIDKELLIGSYNKPEIIPNETRIIFKTSKEPDIFHIASKYNIKDYHLTDIAGSFKIIVYNFF